MRFFSICTLFLILPFSALAQLRISAESGIAFSQYNDVRAPNGEQRGTFFSLTDDFAEQPPTAFVRLELAYLINNRHTIEVTAAPLQLEYQDARPGSIDFSGTTFFGDDIDGTYKFNTYRLSYRYRLIRKPAVTLDLGATLLLRDARIALRQGNLEAEETDLGAVPLVSFEFNYQPADKLSLLLKGDALVGPQGRAEDIFGGVLFHLLADKLKLKAGYRFIEGGADVEQVYNFAYIHFIDLGLVYRL